MFGVIARTIRYTAFFSRLTTQHVVIDEFDQSTNCARVVVIETGFPGNEQCIEGVWTPGRIDSSDVTFEDQPEPTTESAPVSDLPDVVSKGRF